MLLDSSQQKQKIELFFTSSLPGFRAQIVNITDAGDLQECLPVEVKMEAGEARSSMTEKTGHSLGPDVYSDESDDSAESADYTFLAVMLTMLILSITALWQIADRLWKSWRKRSVRHHLRRPSGHGSRAVKSASDAGKAAYHSW